MEGWDIIFFNDVEVIINVFFLNFWGNGWIIDCGFFDFFYVKIGYNWVNRVVYCIVMNLFVNYVIEYKIVVG